VLAVRGAEWTIKDRQPAHRQVGSSALGPVGKPLEYDNVEGSG